MGGLRFRGLKGLGFRVQADLGFRLKVWTLRLNLTLFEVRGFAVHSLGFEAHGSGCEVIRGVYTGSLGGFQGYILES